MNAYWMAVVTLLVLVATIVALAAVVGLLAERNEVGGYGGFPQLMGICAAAIASVLLGAWFVILAIRTVQVAMGSA